MGIHGNPIRTIAKIFEVTTGNNYCQNLCNPLKQSHHRIIIQHVVFITKLFLLRSIMYTDVIKITLNIVFSVSSPFWSCSFQNPQACSFTCLFTMFILHLESNYIDMSWTFLIQHTFLHVFPWFLHDFHMLPFHHPSPRKSAGNKGRGELAAKAARKQASQASVGTVGRSWFRWWKLPPGNLLHRYGSHGPRNSWFKLIYLLIAWWFSSSLC